MLFLEGEQDGSGEEGWWSRGGGRSVLVLAPGLPDGPECKDVGGEGGAWWGGVKKLVRGVGEGRRV